jgi:hypothetical protein
MGAWIDNAGAGVIGCFERVPLADHERSCASTIDICTVMSNAHDTPLFDHAANYGGHEVQAPQPWHDPRAVVEKVRAPRRHRA